MSAQTLLVVDRCSVRCLKSLSEAWNCVKGVRKQDTASRCSIDPVNKRVSSNKNRIMTLPSLGNEIKVQQNESPRKRRRSKSPPRDLGLVRRIPEHAELSKEQDAQPNSRVKFLTIPAEDGLASYAFNDSSWILPKKRMHRKRKLWFELALKPPEEKVPRKRRQLRGRLLERCCVPKSGLTQRRISDLLQTHPVLATRSSRRMQLDKSESPYLVLYRWIKCRVAAGLGRSSIIKLSDMLERTYEEALEVIEMMETADFESGDNIWQLLHVRHKLACLWCIFAHAILDICERRTSSNPSNDTSVETSPGKTDSILRGNESDKLFSTAQKHAISILLVARSCPLVGSHQYITLAMSRLAINGTALHASLGESDCPLFSESLLPSLSAAIHMCWDTIDHCNGKEQTKQRFMIHHNCDQMAALILESEHCTRVEGRQFHFQDVARAVKKAASLPPFLTGQLTTGNVMFRDQNTIRTMCDELNRLSRLQESLHRRRLVSMYRFNRGGLLDHLPLFGIFDSMSDVPPPSVCWSQVSHAALESFQDGPATVRWNWASALG